MKGGKVHVLPVSSLAVWDLGRPDQAVEQEIRRLRVSCFRFSSRKPGVHVTQSGAYSILYKLAGRDGVSKKVRISRDLLAETAIDWWSMLHVRRSLTKAMDDAGIPADRASYSHTKSRTAAQPRRRKREHCAAPGPHHAHCLWRGPEPRLEAPCDGNLDLRSSRRVWRQPRSTAESLTFRPA